MNFSNTLPLQSKLVGTRNLNMMAFYETPSFDLALGICYVTSVTLTLGKINSFFDHTVLLAQDLETILLLTL